MKYIFFSNHSNLIYRYIYAQWSCIDPNSDLTTIAPTTLLPNNYTTDYTNNLPTCEVNFEPEGSCMANSIFSPYTPIFLEKNSEYFGYPIYQQTVCSGSQSIKVLAVLFIRKINSIKFFSVNIMCPLPLVVHIYAAYYGIQKSTSMCKLSNSIEPTMCYDKRSFHFITNTCEYKNECQLKADSSHFTNDPCPSFPKQLLVQYQCLEMVI